MSDDRARELQEQGIQAAKAGQRDEARRLLQQAIRLVPRDDTSWLWLASVAQDKRERLLCLQKVLQINPENEMAIKAVRALGVDPDQLAPKGPTIAESLAAAGEVVEGPGVPMPALENIEVARDRAQEIADRYLGLPDLASIVWEHKTKRRAGEREILMLRLQIGALVTVMLTVIIGGLIYIVASSPDVQLVLFGASATPIPPTRTPTNTPTHTPGFTPTPSPTRDFTVEPTFTVSPTMPPEIAAWPTKYIGRTPVPTEWYLPAQPGRAVADAIDKLEAEDIETYEELLEDLEFAQSQLGNIFSPNPYYFEAFVLMKLGRLGEALGPLEEAEQRIDAREGVREEQADLFMTLIDLGFAQVHLEQARQALAELDRVTAETYLEEAQTRAAAARGFDNRLSQAYVAEAEAYRLGGQYEEAIAALDEARTVPDLLADQNISIARGLTYLDWARALARAGEVEAAQEIFDQAAYEGFYTTYINPFVEEGHQLRVQAALERGDLGLAAIYCEDYLLYFPNSAQAFKLYGDIRVQQNKPEFALYNYTQALNSVAADAVLADAHVSRADLYTEFWHYQQALEDLNAAVELQDMLATRALRLPIAYAAGDYETANEDAERLLDTGLVPNSEIWLIQARILVDEAGPNDRRDYNRALELLNRIGGDLPVTLAPFVDEYRARAHYGLGNYGDALNAVNQALAAVETGSRHYLRGLIYEELGEENSAITEYEWVLAWSEVYDYPFAGDARIRIQAFVDAEMAAIMNATATSVAATAQAEMTLEVTAEITPETTVEATMEATPDAEPTPTREGS